MARLFTGTSYCHFAEPNEMSSQGWELMIDRIIEPKLQPLRICVLCLAGINVLLLGFIFLR